MPAANQRRLRIGMIVGYLGLVCAAVLMPQPVRESTGFTHDGPFGTAWLADAIRNVLLFAPIGAFIALDGRSLRHSVVLACALAIGIEVLQNLIPGRFSSPVDVLSNSIGAALGALIAEHRRILWRPTPRIAFRLACASSFAGGATLLGTSGLLVPVVPDGPYFGGFTPILGHLEHYSGQVDHATLDGLPIPAAGPATDSAGLVHRLRDGAVIELSFRTGSPPASLAPLVTLHDDSQHEILLVGVDRDHLVARRMLRAGNLGFENPAQRWPRALAPLAVGSEHRLAIRFDGGTFGVQLDRDALPDRVWTPGRGWSLVIPAEWITQALMPWLDAAWIALLALPAAYHAGRRPRAWCALAGVGVALAVAPAVGAVAPAPATEWAGLLGAMVFGLWLRGPVSDPGSEG